MGVVVLVVLTIKNYPRKREKESMISRDTLRLYPHIIGFQLRLLRLLPLLFPAELQIQEKP